MNKKHNDYLLHVYISQQFISCSFRYIFHTHLQYDLRYPVQYLIGENFVGKNFRHGNYSSHAKYFVTFPRTKFSPVIFERTSCSHYIYVYPTPSSPRALYVTYSRKWLFSNLLHQMSMRLYLDIRCMHLWTGKN